MGGPGPHLGQELQLDRLAGGQSGNEPGEVVLFNEHNAISALARPVKGLQGNTSGSTSRLRTCPSRERVIG